jgi:hypothetical protein
MQTPFKIRLTPATTGFFVAVVRVAHRREAYRHP